MTTLQERKRRHEERTARMDRHMRVLQEFLVADFKDDVLDAEDALADAVARGRGWDLKYYQEQLAKARVKLAEAEAELRAM